jgi:hypothetical protein
MFSRIHEKLGTAGFVISIVALMVALTGGAYAAGALNPKVKKQITKESKKFSKKFSKQFAIAGAPGAKGDAGTPGAKGDAGTNGTNGSNGTSGTNGANGEAGMCSEANPECALPAGGVLTGMWGASGSANDFSLAVISFPLRVSPAPTALLEDNLAGHTVGYELKEGEVSLYGPRSLAEISEALGNGEDPTPLVEEDTAAFQEKCPGSADEPEAQSGFLCIYPGDRNGTVFSPLSLQSSTQAATEYGITVPWKLEDSQGFVRGTWAAAN